MTVDASLVLVAYRSVAVAAAALATFRRECRGLGITAEIVVVDQSEDPGEVDRLSALEPEKLMVLPNRGYAAGVNAGVAASRGRIVLVGNPDIRFEEGSLEALLRALDGGWDVVGPQFVLAGLLFPPADLQTPGEELRRWRAGRSAAAWRRYLAHEIARWRAVWQADAPVAVPALSGALVGCRREALARAGPWDEAYFLYFEEMDWIRRARRRGLRVAQVPGARVEHRWAHTAEPAAMADHFHRSRRRFFRTHFGVWGRLVSALTAAHGSVRPGRLPERLDSPASGALLWLLSPTALGYPAAGFVGSRAAFIGAALEFAKAAPRPNRYVVVAVETASGTLQGPWSWEPGDA